MRKVHDWSANSLDVYYLQRSKSDSLPTWQRVIKTIKRTPAAKKIPDYEISLFLSALGIWRLKHDEAYIMFTSLL